MKKNYKEKTIINKELLIPLQTQFESSTFFEIDFGISEKMFLQSFHLIWFNNNLNNRFEPVAKSTFFR